jgi:hypothetical protein
MPQQQAGITKSNNSRLSEPSRVRLESARKARSGVDANNNSYPNPTLVLPSDGELIGKHPNKAGYIVFGNNEKYAAPELNITVGVNGPFKREGVDYTYPSPLDAASIVLSERTDVTGIVSLVRKANARAAIKATADMVKIHGRDVVEIAAGGTEYIHGTGTKNLAKTGAVHIVAGNRTEGQFDLQPMVKGDNLKNFLDELTETVANINSNQQKIIEMIIKMQAIFTALGTGLSAIPLTAAVGGPILSAVAPDIAKATIALSNNLSSGLNTEFKKINYNQPYSPKNILSRYNKVN